MLPLPPPDPDVPFLGGIGVIVEEGIPAFVCDAGARERFPPLFTTPDLMTELGFAGGLVAILRSHPFFYFNFQVSSVHH
ncbi:MULTISPECIES: hypothetical protein [unclassified Duganella]|uniref:hypothetical protein n=1 Tax=unclassified Duganella TaxID=2636909 RepID=UPI0011C168D0|nr:MULTISPECIES: hypothetical protein [unclassified Duganella]